MNSYLELLFDHKLEGAEQARISECPQKIIKFISLGEDNSDNDLKFNTLKNNNLWFSSVKELNDPYEYKCLYIDKMKLLGEGYPIQFIEFFEKTLIENQQNYAMTALSANTFECLPMWAYYNGLIN